MPCESYLQWFRSLLLCLCDVFQVLISFPCLLILLKRSPISDTLAEDLEKKNWKSPLTMWTHWRHAQTNPHVYYQFPSNIPVCKSIFSPNANTGRREHLPLLCSGLSLTAWYPLTISTLFNPFPARKFVLPVPVPPKKLINCSTQVCTKYWNSSRWSYDIT